MMQTYLVGGAVRDQLLSFPVHERDWVVVGATVQQMLALGYKQVGRDFPVFLHPQTQEEYALARTERKSGHGYQGFVCHSSPDVTLEQDLSRRDLTINAMAMDAQGALIDPYQGQRDLQQRLLRHVSPAFVEDPLRVLRVARFAARYAHLGFRVAADTLALMCEISRSGELAHLSSERIWRELERALAERHPQVFFTVLRDCEALALLFPTFTALAEPDWAALQRAIDQGAPALIRFAVLAIGLAPEQLAQLQQQPSLPRAYRELAALCHTHAPTLREPPSAPQLLALLEQADAFRRGERFAQLLCCAELYWPDATSAATEAARAALQACCTIDMRSLVSDDMRGPQIAQALRAARLERIAATLPARPSA